VVVVVGSVVVVGASVVVVGAAVVVVAAGGRVVVVAGGVVGLVTRGVVVVGDGRVVVGTNHHRFDGLTVVVVPGVVVEVVLVLTGAPSGPSIAVGEAAVVDRREFGGLVVASVDVVDRSTCTPSTTTGRRAVSPRLESTTSTTAQPATTTQNHRPSRTQFTA
jgi:hypothetical protein